MSEVATSRWPARSEFAVATLVALGTVSLFRLQPVPFSNELTYLLAPYHRAHPQFLAGDWTFAGRSDHAVFDLVASLPMRVWSIETVGWIGRLVCWTLLAAGMLRLAQRLGIRPIVGALLVGLWAVRGALYGGEGVFSTFEAKEIAYPLLFWGLERVMADKQDTGALLLGLTFLLHAAVGASVILASVVAFAVIAGSGAELARRTVALAIGGVLGLIAIGPVLLHGETVPSDMWSVMTFAVLPMHFNASGFGAAPVIISYGMLLFNILVYRAGPRERGLKFLVAFQCALGAFTVVGILAFKMGAYGFLRVYPFRVFPLLVPLFFLFSLVRAFRLGQLTLGNRVVAVSGFLVLVSYGPGLDRVSSGISTTKRAWQRTPSDDDRAMMWVQAHTPPSATIIAPPWMKNAFYLGRRPLVANFHAITSDRMAEWRTRNEALIGAFPSKRPTEWVQMQQFYNSLSADALRDVRLRFGGDYLITAGVYALPRLHSEGTYSVYDLRSLGPAPQLR